MTPATKATLATLAAFVAAAAFVTLVILVPETLIVTFIGAVLAVFWWVFYAIFEERP